jgi:hypothetical protein
MKHKRRWSWKKKHVRRYQATKQFLWGGVPTAFVKPYHRANRAKERVDIVKFMQGDEEVDFSPKYHPSSAAWDYW